MSRTFRNVSDALPVLMHDVITDGTIRDSRNGSMVELMMEHITLERPYERYIVTQGRAASLPAQIAETMWVLGGRNDVEFLSNYLPRAGEFSDDGLTWRGGYGPRLRKWTTGRAASPEEFHDSGDWGYTYVTDQLHNVVRLLSEDPNTRRAVMSIFDPNTDYQDSKDIPCNNWISFIARDGSLHAQVGIRSNDLMWGWSGINTFEWSALLEIVAGLSGLGVGSLTFSTTSLHLYERHYGKAERIATAPSYDDTTTGVETPRFVASAAHYNVDGLDDLISRWFRVEEVIRTEPRGSAWRHIKAFPEPMMQSWLYVLYGWYHDNMASTLEQAGLIWTDLGIAAVSSPRHPKAVQNERQEQERAELKRQQEQERRNEFMMSQSGTTSQASASATETAQKDSGVSKGKGESFAYAVASLHAEKHKAYGDSWKRRGELMAIMANCARKVDRLGVDGAGDTSADTAVDLLVYLVKYRLWLTDHASAPKPGPLVSVSGILSDDPVYVEDMLNYYQYNKYGSLYKDSPDSELVEGIRLRFSSLETHAKAEHDSRWRYVEDIIRLAFPLAHRLWTVEQLDQFPIRWIGADNPIKPIKPSDLSPLITLPEDTEVQFKPLGHAARNATRRFDGYNV